MVSLLYIYDPFFSRTEPTSWWTGGDGDATFLKVNPFRPKLRGELQILEGIGPRRCIPIGGFSKWGILKLGDSAALTLSASAANDLALTYMLTNGTTALNMIFKIDEIIVNLEVNTRSKYTITQHHRLAIAHCSQNLLWNESLDHLA